MSNIYIQEPPTKGKVLLNTTVGDIDIELWSKEAPKACRNFVQLCLEGYYDNTIFHRIVKGFCIQGGDPTGTGTGGESIYGKPFKNEVHQRLRFVRRGLVAMANTGKDDNQSQFFFTLGRADELNGKHTIFGKVTGNTVYNMLGMENVEIGENDLPVYPPKIRSTEVLSNPFDDIVPRETKTLPTVVKNDENKKKSKGTKNFSLLSFGEEAEGDEEEVGTISKEIKIKSSHDALDDPKLSSEPAVSTSSATDTETRHESITDDIRSKLNKKNKVEPKKIIESDEEIDDKVSERRKKLHEESRRLQKELRDGKRRKIEKESKEEVTVDEIEDDVGAVREFRQERREYLDKKKGIKKKGSGREAQTMELLSVFQDKLGHIEVMSPENEAQLSEEEEETDNDSWLHHKLVFEDQQRQAKDANVKNEDSYEIFDPRNPINKRRREESKKRQQEKKRK